MTGDDAQMTIRVLRALTVFGAMVALLLPAAAVASSSGKPVQGVVQSVTSNQIVLKALDGSVLSFTVTRSTRVRVKGDPSPVAAIAPGFVATVTHDNKNRATLIEAFGTAVPSTDRGVVTAVTQTAITLRTPSGGTLTVQVDRRTRFRFKGLPATRLVARPGADVVVTHVGDAPALVVNMLKRAGA